MKLSKIYKAETYDEAVKLCPKGYRLPHRWELFKIFEDMKVRKRLSDGDFMFFWSDLVEGNLVKGLFLGGDLGVGSWNGYLAGSDGGGRVVYIKIEKVKR